MTRRGLFLRAASVLVGCGLSALLLAAVVCAYAGYCRLTGTEARLLAGYPVFRRLFTDAAYLDLLRLVTADPANPFDTVWDTTDVIKLSRDEFVPTDMYGHAKFRYKPFLRYIDVEVWSGLERQRLSALDDPRIRRAVRRCRVFREIVIETDENGFKKTDFRLAPPRPVVLFVGDSFTEGLDVASADTFVNLFGHRLEQAGLDGVVANSGVNGYGPLEECWTVEHYADALRVRVVIANLFPNDVDSDYPSVIAGGPVPESSYSVMFNYLDRMWDVCRGRGIALVVAAIPAREQLSPSHPPSPFDMRVSAWCRTRGILFLSPLETFRAAGADEVYFVQDPHLSEKGHARYAAFLFEHSLPVLRKALAR
jgi:GDSL-like lipase/acylhydrolase family protein